MSYNTFIFSTICTYLVLQLSTLEVRAKDKNGKGKCEIIYDDQEKWTKSSGDCEKVTKPDFSRFPTNTTIEEFDFDDNCYQQCIYRRMDLLASPSEIGKNKIKSRSNMAKRRSDPTLLDFVMKDWVSCLDETVAITKKKQLSPCKSISLHAFCTANRLTASVEQCKKGKRK